MHTGDASLHSIDWSSVHTQQERFWTWLTHCSSDSTFDSNESEWNGTKRDFTRLCEIPVKRPGDGFEQTISRILYLYRLSTTQVAIIYLGRQLPVASSDQPES
jgi:hypothetical protein